MPLLLLVLFLGFIVIGLPIAFSMGMASISSFFLLGGSFQIIPQKMFSGLDNFSYLCIPLFILASEIMSTGGILKKIVMFCERLVGHTTGGLAHVNVLGSMFFAGISGSATADAAGLGPLEIEMMTTAGYPKNFSAAVTAASAILGPIIPPSTIMIIYAVVAGNVSVSQLFLAGIMPGILIGVSEMVTCYVISKKNHYPKSDRRATLKEVMASFIDALPTLFLPVIIVGGILSGIFTATESGAVAVLYAWFVAKFILKSITAKELFNCLIRTAKMTANVMFIIAIASAMGWVITALQIPQVITNYFVNSVSSPLVFLMFVNIMLLVIGCILDQSPALLIMVPILLPVAMKLGINPVHFAIVVVINLTIGLVTPPVGMTLFVTANVAKMKLTDMYKAIMPFLIPLFIDLLIITYFPQLVLFIPNLFAIK